MTNEVLENRVEEGFKWFVLNEPNILREADLDTLDMGNDCYCLLGQSFGLFERGLDYLNMPHLQAIELGLDVEWDLPIEPTQLTPYWKSKIEAWRTGQ